MTKRWPVREPWHISPIVEAPQHFTGYDAVQIQVSITPTRGPEDDKVDSVHSRVWITEIEARDMRAIEYITRQLVELAMREWRGTK